MNRAANKSHESRKYLLKLLTVFCVVSLILIVMQSIAIKEYNILEIALRDPPLETASDRNTRMRRLSAIRLAMQHAWNGYAAYAFGSDELRPLTKAGSDSMRLGATVVGSLDTLWVMGLTSEFNEARDWVRDHFNPGPDAEVSFSAASTQVLGGLLSAYALSGDRMFLKKARALGERLMKAVDEGSGIPYSLVNLATGVRRNAEETQGKSVLSEVGPAQLDLVYLSTASGEIGFAEAAFGIFSTVSASNRKAGGKLTALLDTATGICDEEAAFEMSRYYDSLLKLWLFLGGSKNPRAKEYRARYDEGVNSIRKYLLHKTPPNGLVTIVDYNNNDDDNDDNDVGTKGTSMRSETCYAGGMFALGAAMHNVSGKLGRGRANDMNTARQITRTCYEMHARSPTYLAPDSVYMDGNNDPGRKKKRSNNLRPDTVETLFYLWRTTHDAKYREWAWEIFTGVEKYSKVQNGGYSGIRDVLSEEVVKDDLQPAWFTAGTLKYLYLTFSTDDVLPIDKYVFNADGHPFPIQYYVPL